MGTVVKVKRRKAVSPPRTRWPDGPAVRIEKIQPSPERRHLVDQLRAIAASMPDLPSDWAAQHDHYIHGWPKREA